MPTQFLEPAGAPGDGLRRAGLAAWSVLGMVILAAVAAWLLYQIRAVFPPLVLAVAIVFLLNPIISAMQRRGISRVWGTVFIYLIFIWILTVIGSVLIPAVGRQIRQLVDIFPDLVERATSLAERLGDRFGFRMDEVQVRDLLDKLRGETFTGLGRITRFTLGALHLVLIFVLAPIFALYILIDLPRLSASFKDHLPPARREEWLMLLERCGQAVGGFFRGQLLVAVLVGVLSSLALWAIRVPFWLAIGMLAGLFNLIPLVGPFVGGGMAVIVGGIEGGLTKAVLAALAMLAIQQLDNHVISPNVMGRAVRLHPVTIMVALLGGGTLAGLWGMLLVVPGSAIVKILWLHYYTTQVLGGPSPARGVAAPPPTGPEPTGP